MGGLHIETEPAVLSEPLRVEYIGTTTDLDGIADEVEQGVQVSVSRVLAPDAVQIVANDVVCGEAVDIVANVELDVQLEVKATGACRVFINITHALGKVGHPIRGAIMGAVVPQGATVVFRPLDPLSTAPTVEIVAGATGVESMEFPLERYEVTATLRGEVLITTQVDLRQTPDIVLDLMALAPSVPRACNGLDPVTCEDVIRAAMAYGQWVGPTDTVTSVAIEPTTVRSCEPYIDPKLKVMLQLANPAGDIDVTVGTHTKTGRWIACSPY